MAEAPWDMGDLLGTRHFGRNADFLVSMALWLLLGVLQDGLVRWLGIALA
jgi:hypothetical protein